jgi:gamma-glutamyltranspeptidase / glutathione hydrolase
LISEKFRFGRRECARFLLGLLLTFQPAIAQEPNPTTAPQPTRGPSRGVGSKGMVVSGRAVASEAGTRMLNADGNAADAGAATLLALSVLTVGAFCIGGEVPILYYNAATKNIKVLGGQGGAPRDPKAIEWYLQNRIPGGGVVRSAPVPAALDAIVTLLKIYGTKSFEEAVKPTLDILDAGGPSWYIDTGNRQRIETGVNWYADLAVTFRKLVEAEQHAMGNRDRKLQAVADRFYRGDIADALEQWYVEKGGFLRKVDLAAYRTRVEDPVVASYRGYDVYKVGPWTQGPFVLETLRILEGYDLKKMGFLSADYIHVVTEAMKLGLADRDEFYGDPEYVKVPMSGLLSDGYTRLRRPLIDMKRASLEVRPGDPDKMNATKTPMPVFPAQGGTTNMCVVDKWGNMIAATPSGLSSTAGVAGKTGIIHGSRLTSLNTWKGHPNVIERGKRPRVTLTPTLVMKSGKPVAAIAVAGGDLQDQAAIQLILEMVDFGMPAEEAFSAPRFSTAHHTSSFGQSKPKFGGLSVNTRIGEAVQADLKSRGHALAVSEGNVGGVALIGIPTGSNEAHGIGSGVSTLK